MHISGKPTVPPRPKENANKNKSVIGKQTDSLWVKIFPYHIYHIYISNNMNDVN